MTREQILKAAQATLDIAKPYMQNLSSEYPELDWDHLCEMHEKMQDMVEISELGKLNRWLGWMQAAVVASCDGSVRLEDLKIINKWVKDE